MQHPPSPVRFREDINGLRAWAVMAVLLFHFSLFGVAGGFVGVDVFFVISGYLMTSIIIGGLEKGSFSILKFYMARIRRILPALLVVLFVLLVVGWFWLPRADYQELGKQTAYSLAFLSNFDYWASSGYFDADSHEKWLLHTWSLAVEAQFYVLFPVILVLCWRFWPTKKGLFTVLGVLFAMSLALNLFVTKVDPSLAFYFLPTRAWELLSGGLAYLLARQIHLRNVFNNTVSWVGWILILSSMLFINDDLAWPGYWALIPVLGTSLVIFARHEENMFTSNFIVQWLGDRSYSLYLWHWPLIVGLYLLGRNESLTWLLGALVLSLMLAHISYNFIESPTRQYRSKKKLKQEILIIGFLVLMIGVAAIMVQNHIFKNSGAKQVSKDKYLSFFSRGGENLKKTLHEYRNKCNFKYMLYNMKKDHISDDCVSLEQGGVFLWGDSHAQALGYGIRRYLSSQGIKIPYSQVATSACRPHLSPEKSNGSVYEKPCAISNKYALESIKKTKPKLVIIAQRQHHEDNNLLQISEYLLDIGVKRVIVVGPVPQWSTSLPKIIVLRHWDKSQPRIKDSSFDSKLLKTDQLMKIRFNDVDPQIQYISILDKLCNEDGCIAKVDRNQTPLVWDYSHLTHQGSVFISNEVLNEIIGKTLSSI